MKKKKSLFALAMVALLLITSCIIISASTATAGNQPYDLKVQSRTLLLEDSVYIRYYVPVEGTNGADVKMIFWLEPQDEYVYGTQDYTLSPNKDTVVSGSAEYYIFDFKELAAKQMTVDVYARIYVADESGEHYGKLNKYGVLHYCYYMLGKTSTNVPDADFENLLNSLLSYGAAAQKYFNENTSRPADADYYQIKVKNALLPDGSTSGLYLKGDEITVTAAATNEAGEEFLYWQNGAGTQMCNEQAYTITVGEQNETYTAVYGVKGPIATDASYFTFTELADGTYSIKAKDVNNMPAEVVIPATYNGKAVTSIGQRAFLRCYSLTSIAIPNSVANIGEGVFYDCFSLKTIYYGGTTNDWKKVSINSINNSKLTSATRYYYSETPPIDTINTPYTWHYVNGVPTVWEVLNDPYFSFMELEDGTYMIWGKNVTSLPEELVIPGTYYGKVITRIGDFAFEGCTSKSIIIPDTITIIGRRAFQDCKNITTIIIPDGVKGIDNMAFSGCAKLTKISIPDSVTQIVASAFSGCTNLTSITIPNSVTKFGNGMFIGCTNLTSIVIPDSITSIGKRTFEDCANLTDIVIPNTVTSIGEDAFLYCNKLKNIYYCGTAANWKEISIDDSNSPYLTYGVRYYYYSETAPTTSGNYWRYVDGVPTAW